jgi:hypothetical protein
LSSAAPIVIGDGVAVARERRPVALDERVGAARRLIEAIGAREGRPVYGVPAGRA